jgi:dipeptidase D
MFGMKVENHSEYPSWKPALNNPILDLVKEAYKELHGNDPHVTAIHAGLECGILRDKIGPIDVVSFGPTITGAHSPDESVNIPSVEKFWYLYKSVLAKI